MDLRIFTEPQQGASYDDLLAVARAAERLGFDAFFRSDHYLVMGDHDGLPGPSDAWITLAGLARDTRTIRLGTLVTAATFRLPGPLAITVAQVDAMSGGRVELGLGAGWFEAEHTAYGIPFPSVAERFDRLEEQYAVIAGLGKTVQAAAYLAARFSALAARYAQEFNAPFSSVQDTAAAFSRVRAACEDAGRDSDSLVYSAAQVLCCGRDEAEIARRAAAIGREVDELRENGLAGTPDEVVAKALTFGAAGAARLYLQVLDLSDLDHLELVAAEVMPHLR